MKNFLCISVLILCVSCTQQVELPEFEFEREVVVNSIISTQDIWRLDLSYTKSRTDARPIQKINEANVKVRNLSNGQIFDLDFKKAGEYVYHLNPLEGHIYEIEVTTQDYEKVNASTYVPRVLDVEAEFVKLQNGKDERYREINIKIEDDPETEDFYIWEIVEMNQTSVIGETTISTVDTTGTEPGEPGPNFEDITPDFEFFDQQPGKDQISKNLNEPEFIKDSEFDGTFNTRITIEKEFLYGKPGSTTATTANFDTPKYKLVVMAVSEDLYYRVLSLQKIGNSSQGSTSQDSKSFLYSNIENGRGIFGGYNLKEFPIEFQ